MKSDRARFAKYFHGMLEQAFISRRRNLKLFSFDGT